MIVVLAPYALVKDIDLDKDDIENDNSYFITTTMDGLKMATEWTPELRLGIHKAVATIPHVVQQAWHYIGLETVDRVLDAIQSSEAVLASQSSDSQRIKTVILNFTDGMETDGWVGITAIRGLEARGLAFTGADSVLYYLDSDKALIKRHLVESHTPTPGYFDVYSTTEMLADEKKDGHRGKEATYQGGDNTTEDPNNSNNNQNQNKEDQHTPEQRAAALEGLAKLTFPLLVKPANSSSSRGISTKSVVDSPEEAYERAMETKRIWGPVYVEEYITGREYTALVSGSERTGIHVYKVLERVFRAQIPERERLLTHEMKWGENCYGKNASVAAASWWMQICLEPDQTRLQKVSKEIYASFGGNGYCRMDLREDHRTGKIYVVDVNANCSIDEDEDCAMGQILKSSGLTLGQFFAILMDDAIKVRDNLVVQSTHSGKIADKLLMKAGSIVTHVHECTKVKA
ncbi:hypothetical protein BGZ93_003018 [Podila epicladia]|nr:hypothetical protein BGZ92_007300 [Podila epicladia]KAG0097310.1 hypothetical protein BGZ93_003018 [Podila epicladia]